MPLRRKGFVYRHVDDIIFTEREIRSLQPFLSEYKHIVSDYGCTVGGVRSYIYIIKAIVYKERNENKRSESVYDFDRRGEYIEAAISSRGISDHQLLENLAPGFSKKNRDISTAPRPLYIGNLEIVKKCVNCC